MELLQIAEAIMQYLIIPGGVWIFHLHQTVSNQGTDIRVLQAQNTARELTRAEDREATRRQLDQIVSMLQTLNGRIDAVMRSEK